MTLIQIYCIGFVTQAIWFAVIWFRKSKKSKDMFYGRLDELSDDLFPEPRKILPFALLIACLIWPYFLLDKFILSRKGSIK